MLRRKAERKWKENRNNKRNEKERVKKEREEVKNVETRKPENHKRGTEVGLKQDGIKERQKGGKKLREKMKQMK